MKTKSLFITALFTLVCCTAVPAPAQDPRPASPPVADDGRVLTRAFVVPPDFLTRGGPLKDSTPPADPFATPSAASNAKDKRSAAQKVLESLGVSFAAEGSAVSHDSGNSRLIVRNTAAQLDIVETLIASMNDGGVAEGVLQFEIISLPILAARKEILAHPVEADLYQSLDAALDRKDSGAVLEHIHTLRVRSGQRSKVEGINEFAYPTEMDPPQIPQNISIAAPSAAPPPSAGEGRVFPPWPYTAVTPASFAVRNLGWTVEAELTFSEDRKTADLNLAPELVKFISRMPQGITGEILLPVFETQKSSSQVHTWVGQPALVSTMSPPTDTGIKGGNRENRVWLLFVTVTRPQ
jgi:hypothetical protein